MDKAYPDLTSVLQLIGSGSMEIPLVSLTVIWGTFPALLPDFGGMTLQAMVDALLEGRSSQKWHEALTAVEMLDEVQGTMFESVLVERCAEFGITRMAIGLVMNQTFCSRAKAIAVLNLNRNDIVEAILQLEPQRPPPDELELVLMAGGLT